MKNSEPTAFVKVSTGKVIYGGLVVIFMVFVAYMESKEPLLVTNIENLRRLYITKVDSFTF